MRILFGLFAVILDVTASSHAADIYVTPGGGGIFGGSGSSQAPYRGDSIERVAKIIEHAPAESTVHFSEGIFPIQVVVKKSLTLLGEGDATILENKSPGAAAIQFYSKSGSLKVQNLAMSYTGGWSANGCNTGILVTGPSQSVTLDRVKVTDFYNAVYTASPLRYLTVTSSRFLSTYGRAGVSSAPPYQHPAVAILGSGSERTMVQDCSFDGLVDSTFSGMKGSPPRSQRTPMDGFYKTGGGNPKVTIIENNVVKHHGIEGIICERMEMAGAYVTQVTSNTIIGPTYKERSFYGNYCPAIVIRNVQNAKVIGNSVTNSPLGVDLWFSAWADSNSCTIANNTFRNVLCAARLTDAGSKTIFENNNVFCSSEPTKSVQDSSIGWCGLTGVAASGNPIIRNNVFNATPPAWDAKTKLLSQNKNLFTLQSTKGIVANQGVLIAIRPQGISYFPVQGIKGQVVTVASQWVAHQSLPVNASLVYARNLGNFTSLGAVCSFGVQSRVLCQSNKISGFVQDLATSNSGIIVDERNSPANGQYVPPNSRWIVREKYSVRGIGRENY